VTFRPTFCNFILGTYCVEKIHTSTSYVVCTKVRRHIHKQITKRRHGEEKPRPFFFGKQVLFTLGLRLTTPYSMDLLVWRFYQTFVTMSIDLWLRFEPQIRPTRLTISFLLISARVERKVRLCVKLFNFFLWLNTHPFDQKFVAFCPKYSGNSYVEF